jgi:hypothetical protein
MRRVLRLAAALALLAPPLAAQSPSPSPAADRLELQSPPAPVVDTSAKTAKAPGPRPSAASTADAGVLKEMKAIALGQGEARISLRSTVRTLRPGDVVEGSLVKAIGDGRILLSRPEPGGGESTVIVTFDAQGRASVRVINLRDHTSRQAGPR